MPTEFGKMAEEAAAGYLVDRGFSVLARNWRCRWCEIDIVATRGATIYFVEVKYRRSTRWGDGLEYITPKKLRQMHFAAALWIARYNWTGDYCVSAVAVTGSQFTVSDWLAEV